MWPYLESIDQGIFFFLNRELQNSFFDWFMPLVTNLKNFTYPLIALGIWILWKQRRAGLVFLIFIGLTLAITDQFSSHLLKNWIGRIRPCHVLSNIHMLTDCNTSYSFPSSHAVNSFAAAYFLSQAIGRLSPIAFGVAAIAGYSRIYIGIHYPLDVIGGAGIGLLIAWPMRWLKDRCLSLLEWRPSPRGLGKSSDDKDVGDQKPSKRSHQ